jgi:uncharacterized protein YecE (DUF72 family)
MTRDQPLSVDDRRAGIDAFRFKQLHPNLKFGTASDRYAGWIGQIYSERWNQEITRRSRQLQGTKYEERRVPIASVREYFDHFSVLEIDFTFYRTLRDAEGEPSNTFFTLEKYARHAPGDASFLLKAPQKFSARKIRHSNSYEENDSFLAADSYIDQFHQPALELLGDRLTGIIFQQEYQRVGESPSPADNVSELDSFFAAVPSTPQIHVELRSEHLLKPVYFDWLTDRGLGFVFSHWTWLPPIREQWNMCGKRFSAGDDTAVTRLLTPLNTKYAEAYKQAYPFDRSNPELAETPEAQRMIDDTTALAYRAIDQHKTLMVIANNRAYGNSPALARDIGHRILDFWGEQNP